MYTIYKPTIKNDLTIGNNDFYVDYQSFQILSFVKLNKNNKKHVTQFCLNVSISISMGKKTNSKQIA